MQRRHLEKPKFVMSSEFDWNAPARRVVTTGTAGVTAPPPSAPRLQAPQRVCAFRAEAAVPALDKDCIGWPI